MIEVLMMKFWYPSGGDMTTSQGRLHEIFRLCKDGRFRARFQTWKT